MLSLKSSSPALALGACLLVLSLGGHAAVVKDQTTIDPAQPLTPLTAVGKVLSVPNEPDREYQAAQSLTAGQSGFLYQVDVWVARQEDVSGDLQLRIGDVDFIEHSSSPLGSFSIQASNVSASDFWAPALVSVNVRSANIYLHAGDSFVISLSAPSSLLSSTIPSLTTYSWAANAQDVYAGGMRFIRNVSSDSTWIPGAEDAAVTTWMETSPVPEPYVWQLALTGLAGIGLFRRRRIKR